MRSIGDFLALVLALSAIAALAGVWFVKSAERPGPLTAETTVEVPSGRGLRAVARALEADGVVHDARTFEVLAVVRGKRGALRAGEYAIPAGASAGRVLRILTEGKAIARRFTAPEGLTSAEIVARLMAADGLTGEIPAIPEEGGLLPETYHYRKGESRAALVARMAAAARETLAELWAARADGLPFETPRDAVILASIVEKETGQAGERARIAGVFTSRLRRGMRLQSDPTAIYALTGGKGPLGRALRRSDLEIDSPYNTYLHAGLPPGPIANPGRAALEAALRPEETGDLYFVADGSGGHAFARTLREHNANVARWRRVQRERAER